MSSSLLTGASYLKHGFSLIKSPGIRRYAVLPVLVNIIVFGLAIWFGLDLIGSLIERFLPQSDSWWAQAMRGTVWLVAGAFSVLLLFFGFTTLANLIAAPFNGALSEAVERKLSGDTAAPRNMGQILAGAPRMVINEAGKALYFVLMGLLAWVTPLILTGLIPGVNLVGGVVSMLLSYVFLSWMHAVEYVDYPMSNHHQNFKAVRRTVKSRRALAFGFGLAVLGAMCIPVLNLFAMPAAVAGATRLWHEHFRNSTSE